jgi:hypothetical protein
MTTTTIPEHQFEVTYLNGYRYYKVQDGLYIHEDQLTAFLKEQSDSPEYQQ